MWQVWGQEWVLDQVQRALEQGRLHHAYLLMGPPQVGKMTLALNLAQAVNCTDPAPPCGQCSQCRRIQAGLHADVQVLGLEVGEGERSRAEIGIDAIREIHRAAHLQPYEGRYRVFIIDEAERLSLEAANSLLKLLEEPPPRVLLLLLTTHPEDLPPTVVSRCQRLELRSLSREQVREMLTQRYGMEEEGAQELARLSQGCLGWALQAAQDPEVLRERNSRLERIAHLSQAPLQERFTYAEEVANLFQRHRPAGRQELYLWLRWWRDIMLTKVGLDQWIAHLSYGDHLRQQAQEYRMDQITEALHGVHWTLEAMDRNVNARMALELLMLTLPSAPAMVKRG